MLKLAIAAMVSIVFLSSANTVAAKDRSKHKHLGNLPTPNLSARQSKSNAPQSDLKGINQAINQYFKEKNNKELLAGQTGGACFFFEVKSLKLVSLADGDAEILAKVAAQGYSMSRSNNSSQWIYEKTNASIPAKIEHMILLKKINNKWKVSASVV
jgi:hypothetical protein